MFQLNSSWEEIRNTLHDFYRVMLDSLSLIKMKSYWSAKIDKLQQYEGRGQKLEYLQELVA